MFTENLSEGMKRAVIGAQAPLFTLRDTHGNEWRLSDHRDKVVALLFYPKNETLVCTRQLCSVRDRWAEYLATGAEVVGVSPGTVEEHAAFAQSHSLPMPLLADVGGIVTRAYGYHEWLPIWATRTLVVVDTQGVVRSRKAMLRAFRPSDRSVIAAIYAARAELMSAQIEKMSSRWTR